MEALDLFTKYIGLFLDTTWVWMPFVLAMAFFFSWMYYIQRYYWRSLDWVMLEVKPPREIERTPKTMEQIFAGLWGSFGTVSTKYDKYISGKLQDYFSFEIVGSNGEIHFYIRTLRKYRDLVEAQIYSQYQQAEIKEVEDYIWSVPADIPNKNWDLWGTKLKLEKEGIYPIRTYQNLLDVMTTKQPNFLDPLAGLMENLGKLKYGEQIWIQFVFRPVADDWQKGAKKLADKMLGKVEKKEPGILRGEISNWTQAILAAGQEIATGTPGVYGAEGEEKKEEKLTLLMLAPADRLILEGIAEKAAKKGYQVKLQWAYIGRREIFNPANIGATMGFFNQFANLNMNNFKPESASMTKANYAFAKVRKAYKQRKLMRLLRTRSFWEKGYLLNIEELATLCHFPTMAVQAPMTPYIEIKKSGAPMDLPME